MLIENLRRLLLFTAALLTVAGSLPVYCCNDCQWATFFAEAEDGEEDQREELIADTSEPVVDKILQLLCSSDLTVSAETPIVCGPHNERGPPVA